MHDVELVEGVFTEENRHRLVREWCDRALNSAETLSVSLPKTEENDGYLQFLGAAGDMELARFILGVLHGRGVSDAYIGCGILKEEQRVSIRQTWIDESQVGATFMAVRVGPCMLTGEAGFVAYMTPDAGTWRDTARMMYNTVRAFYSARGV